MKTEFGYHLIQPLAAVKAGSVTPFAEVKAQIRTQLLEERKSKAVNDWAADIQKEYEARSRTRRASSRPTRRPPAKRPDHRRRVAPRVDSAREDENADAPLGELRR